jgi:hypothetical protein
VPSGIESIQARFSLVMWPANGKQIELRHLQQSHAHIASAIGFERIIDGLSGRASQHSRRVPLREVRLQGTTLTYTVDFTIPCPNFSLLALQRACETPSSALMFLEIHKVACCMRRVLRGRGISTTSVLIGAAANNLCPATRVEIEKKYFGTVQMACHAFLRTRIAEVMDTEM